MKNALIAFAFIIIAGLIYYVVATDEVVVIEQTNTIVSTTTGNTSTTTTVTNTTTNTNTNTNNGDAASVGVVELNVNGTIAKVDSSQIVYDGPTIITVNVEGGAQMFLSIPSMGINLCPARANMADVGSLKVGDKIEARGQIAADGSVTPCEYSSHYLRVVAR